MFFCWNYRKLRDDAVYEFNRRLLCVDRLSTNCLCSKLRLNLTWCSWSSVCAFQGSLIQEWAEGLKSRCSQYCIMPKKVQLRAMNRINKVTIWKVASWFLTSFSSIETGSIGYRGDATGYWCKWNFHLCVMFLHPSSIDFSDPTEVRRTPRLILSQDLFVPGNEVFRFWFCLELWCASITVWET